MRRGSQPAFARPVSEDWTSGDQPDGNSTVAEQRGMSKRELIAAMALQGVLSNAEYAFPSAKDTAEFALEQADALLEELDR